MALIECYECKGKVSSKAKACPHCGLPIEVDIGYYDNGQMMELAFMKNGIWDGLWTVWYENGQKMLETNLVAEKRYGLETWWYESGQKWREANYKDDKRNGPGTWWYENGQKGGGQNRKDDKMISAESWKPNGEKCPETNVKDGNGLLVVYCYDGPGLHRSTYKNGERVED
jgi:antitoxin component YwqK of YwqJK toxin-antitoxin module